jgi:hypothetical protein
VKRLLLQPPGPFPYLTSIAPRIPSASARPAHIHPAAPHTPPAEEAAAAPHTLLVPAAGTHRHSPLGILGEEVPHTRPHHTRSAAAGAGRTASVVDTQVAVLGHTSREGVDRLASREVGVVRRAKGERDVKGVGRGRLRIGLRVSDGGGSKEVRTYLEIQERPFPYPYLIRAAWTVSYVISYLRNLVRSLAAHFACAANNLSA